MMVDPEEHIVEPTENGAEKDNLTIINPDNLETEAEQLQDLMRADDYDAMKEIVLPVLAEEPKILSDTVFTWEIENWRAQNKKEHGPIFQAAGFPWRILLFPFGNNVDQCSIYLEHGFEANEIPEDWSCCVQFALVLWNPNEPTIFAHHSAHHRFTKEESDWGFTKFLENRRMYAAWDASNRPMIENDFANITVYVRHVEDETGVLWHNFNNYDSKKETGFVGLKNQGATCYLNSLLQSLYFTNAFRKAVYEIPTEEEESMNNSAYTLQRLFYQLQTSNSAVGTNELTKSFGWETRHIFEQQDVQELSRKLMERMEEKMKGTKAQNVLPQMFSGKIKTYISCINVDYESSRVEDFWDVQLNVSGNKNLQESFQDYIQVEKMEGENQYMAGDQFKLQDANKGVIFMSFPDVLHLQLKRFEYDYMRDTMTKINDRYEFPETFDASPFLSEDADKSQPWTYQLHGVLVHSGDLNAGHYYAFLKPNKEGWFYKYDDDKVTKATSREVLEDNFGGEYRQPQNNVRNPLQRKAPIMRPNSAYMLVYIRQSRLDNILCPVTQEDIPKHLRLRFEEEAAIREARRKEREEQHLYMTVRAIVPSSFAEHGGTDLGNFEANPELDLSAPRYYRTLRSSTVQDLVNRIAEDIEEDPKKVRLWLMVNRQNKTVRPDTPMMDTRLTVEESYNKSQSHHNNMLRVWVEVAEEVSAEGEAVWPTYQGQSNGMVVKNDLILLFLKHFDAENQSLHGIGHVYINKEKKVEELVPLICKKMGWGEKLPGDDKVMLWEEIKPTMIESLRAKQTLKTAELQDGDIVCFQRTTEKKSGLEKRLGLGDKASEELAKKADRCEDAREYYDFLQYKRTVKFHAHPTRADPNKYPPFELVLSAKITYDQLAEKVGAALEADPTHLRFYTVNAATAAPRVAIKRLSTNQTLQSILTPSGYSTLNQGHRNDALYFEVLDMSLAELDTKKNIKITWLSEGITKEEPLDILVAKNGIIEDVISGVVKKAQIPDEAEAGKIRVFEVNNHKIFREMSREYPVISINEYTGLVAERMLEEEADATDKDFINCFHFQNEPNRAHGMPFRFLLVKDEKFSDTKKRLEKRTGLKGKSFEKIKFALVRRPYSKVHYLQDDDVLTELATEDDDNLGLDHVDRTRSARNGTGDLFLK
ncbi:cysteine proteinase [Cryphonectria parasitica EP155]|uniref:ubiquitinyl hydrolase 1 n=1 Tax=Cryphonectria parasitica (strain ATCC 38755 / EP155) TaxID=660469 RepID=A0A9P5CTS9_CRYP1|nr:cysteine proteinase [Cryphonectria parasitica EP155]KAF3770974.1 cysteine proteinase [Cryphonectria parasitica EP155]